ncbi:MAG TPA: zinc ribbon domain-containing protein [Phycisphaerae bacterium]|nr:zinc ribbon domain-containing protein [Phycisphaerae bacterium]HPM23641.1 zinc ribbon domain-containing protein [Phycisphaerae bacterium]
MPTYEYLCPKCGHVFEESLVKIGDDSPRPCPNCQYAKAARKPSTFSAGHSQPKASGCTPRRG